MFRLNAAHATHQEIIAYVRFLNLAFDTSRPNFVGTDQPIQNAIVTLAQRLRWKAFDTPFVFHANADVLKLLVSCEIAGLRWLGGNLVPHDMKHFLLHEN